MTSTPARGAVSSGPVIDHGIGGDGNCYLISNVVGILLPNGFDVSGARGDFTTWTRLGRDDRDALQREFDPDARPRKLVERFEIRT